MATDDRGHTVPGGSDKPKRAAINDLSSSIRDIMYVANTTARATAATALSPSASDPLYVHRGDAPAGAQLEVTTDGTNFYPITSRSCYSHRINTYGTSVPNNTWKVIDGWIDVDTHGITYTGSGVWTVTVAGFYIVNARLTFSNVASPAGQRAGRIMLNTTVVDEAAGGRGDATYNTTVALQAGFVAAVGDTISPLGYHTQGAALTLATSDGANQVSIVRVCA